MARILVVDDEPVIVMVLQRLLAKEGHEIVTAHNGLYALERLSEPNPPDLVLVDLFMPGVSGKAVLETIRCSDNLREIPVILVTGAVPQVEDFPPKGSYQEIINKPFDLQDVLTKVRTLLAAKNERRASAS